MVFVVVHFLSVLNESDSHGEAAEAGDHFGLVLEVGGFDGAHQLLLLRQPGVKQTLQRENQSNPKRGNELARGLKLNYVFLMF